jgi:hypothetical protein
MYTCPDALSHHCVVLCLNLLCSSLLSRQCTLLQLEFDMYKQAAKILETREGEINILLDNLEG